ncbi:MAG TPA: hypothetical protein ENI58_06030 [Nitrospirae bacterium]|nr:hypothetical protein [Nitrospirota bacterium]
MKAKVTEQGVLIPKALLEGILEVEILKENSRILVVPSIKKDPIYQLGSNPITCNMSDASEKHDTYLYGQYR